MLKTNGKASIIKLSTIATLMGCSMVATQVAANSGVIQFIGSVSDVTCDITAVDNDGVEDNVIDLGVVSTSDTAGDEVSFSLKPRAGTTCDMTGKTSADIGWASTYWTGTGLSNGKGTATGFGIKLTSVDASTDLNSSVTNTNVALTGTGTMEFEAKYKAQMVEDGSAKTPGTVESNATFTVAYK